MARTKTSKIAENESVVNSVVTPVVEKKTKKTKVVAETVVAPVNVVVDTPPVLNAESEVVDTVVDSEISIAVQSIEFISKMHQISVMLSNLKTEYRTLEKKWSREIKLAQKQSSRRKRKAGNRAPSGFVKPTKISDELANFLGKEKGSEMARTEVTRDINQYIRKNNLQDKENGRKINPDSSLATLLKLKKTDELTYFNLQRYMSPHFAKANKDFVASVASVASVDSVASVAI